MLGSKEEAITMDMNPIIIKVHPRANIIRNTA